MDAVVLYRGYFLPDGSKIWLDDMEFYLPLVLWLLSAKDGNFRELESSVMRFKAE